MLSPPQPCRRPTPLPAGLDWRARLGWIAHMAKALGPQHHRDLRPLVAELLPPDGVALDIGAHAGQMARLMSAVASRGEVIALEPGPYALSILTRVQAMGRLPRTRILPIGLSDAPARLPLRQPLKPGGVGFGLSHLGPASDPRPGLMAEIDVLTLDALTEALGLRRLDLVKADIEGWEIPVLRGGLATLRRFAPSLILELNKRAAARAGTDPAEAWRLLAPLGYRAERLPDRTVAADFLGDGDYLFRIGR